MPIMTIHLVEGRKSDAQMAECASAITAVASATLESVLPRMVRITFIESAARYVAQSGQTPGGSALPTVLFQLGPGRSDPAIAECIRQMTEAIGRTLDESPANIRIFIVRDPGTYFSIGGAFKFENQAK